MANESEGKLQKDQLPNFVASAKGKPGFHYLISNALYLLLIPLFVIVLTYDLFSTLSTIYDLFQIWNELSFKFDNVTVLLLVVLCLVSLVFTTIYLMSRPKNVYLVNFSCYKPDPSRMCTRESFLQIASQTGKFSDETLAFKKKILERSGIGNMTYGPKSLMENPAENGNMEEARKETEGVIIGAVDELLAKTGVKPKAIGILVVNSSLFNPTPSLSAFIVNHYKLRSNIFSYNLGDIKLAFEHFCIHTGGRGVLDGIEKNLQLNEWHMEPSRMTLNRFGNTSSSSVWYELACSEAKRRIRKGDRICQIGFGSGFKCSTVVWRALKTINLNPTLDKNPWIDEIDNFPVQVPQDAPIAF
ncbi:hypothetical protein WN944_003413 [Citrus x changshan-huyou]|uniref:very-long-chain 3-oxoacyl-CoA synthase n=1 Tax=Citrus x changshan-huyou TaxID=2935761 RepID=A0AAP0QGT7_9ROSI